MFLFDVNIRNRALAADLFEGILQVRAVVFFIGHSQVSGKALEGR